MKEAGAGMLISTRGWLPPEQPQRTDSWHSGLSWHKWSETRDHLSHAIAWLSASMRYPILSKAGRRYRSTKVGITLDNISVCSFISGNENVLQPPYIDSNGDALKSIIRLAQLLGWQSASVPISYLIKFFRPPVKIVLVQVKANRSDSRIMNGRRCSRVISVSRVITR